MQYDADAVPVTVTVGHPAHPHRPPDGPPHSLLPFTGSAVGVLLIAGVLLALVGCTLVAAVRRRTRPNITGRSA